MHFIYFRCHHTQHRTVYSRDYVKQWTVTSPKMRTNFVETWTILRLFSGKTWNIVKTPSISKPTTSWWSLTWKSLSHVLSNIKNDATLNAWPFTVEDYSIQPLQSTTWNYTSPTPSTSFTTFTCPWATFVLSLNPTVQDLEALWLPTPNKGTTMNCCPKWLQSTLRSTNPPPRGLGSTPSDGPNGKRTHHQIHPIFCPWFCPMGYRSFSSILNYADGSGFEEKGLRLLPNVCITVVSFPRSAVLINFGEHFI